MVFGIESVSNLRSHGSEAETNAKSCLCWKDHREIKGRFRKRVVLANVPSFRSSFRGSMRTYPRSGFRSRGTSERTLVPVFVPGEHPPKPPVWKTTLLGSSEKRGRQLQ